MKSAANVEDDKPEFNKFEQHDISQTDLDAMIKKFENPTK